MNELLESQGREYNQRVDEIINEKQLVVTENRQLRSQLNEAYNEIGTLKERLDTLTSELDRRDG
jgi:uncharacterized coiled-coil DUF342 family protein